MLNAQRRKPKKTAGTTRIQKFGGKKTRKVGSKNKMLAEVVFWVDDKL